LASGTATGIERVAAAAAALRPRGLRVRMAQLGLVLLLLPLLLIAFADAYEGFVTDGERELSMLYSNHSCDANLGIRGEITFVAIRDIRAGEELTHDWAMTDDDAYSVECKCGALNCRETVTGKDWQHPELQKRYAGYFSTYLARKIAAGCHSDTAT